MKLKPRDIERFIKNPDRDIIIYLIYGPDTGLVRERAETLSKNLIDNIDDPFAVTRLTDDDLKADPAGLCDALAAYSLTRSDRLVRLRLGRDMASLADVINDVETGIQICEAKLVIEAGDLKKASKLRKSVEDISQGAAIACYADDGRNLIAIAEEQLAEEGLKLEPAARNVLIPFLEGDRALARKEIEKLILYKGVKGQRGEDNDIISCDDIYSISVTGADTALDQIIEPALTGQCQAVDHHYNQALASGSNPVAILRALQRRLDQISIFHDFNGDQQALARSGVPRFGPAADKFKTSTQSFKGRRFTFARKLAFDTERHVKRSGAAAEPLVGELLIRLARASQK